MNIPSVSYNRGDIMDEFSKVNKAVEFIKKEISWKPHAGIILGSGLGRFTEIMEIEKNIPYAEIPFFPVTTVEGHAGNLIFGKIGGKKGSLHFRADFTFMKVIRRWKSPDP